MDISPSGYPWNNRVEPSEYPWDNETEDLQDIICRIEEDFPPDSTIGVSSYIATPYNNPLFHLFNGPQLEAPNSLALHSPAPHSPAPHSPAPHSPAPHSPAPHSPAPHSPAPHSPAPHSPAPHFPAPHSPVPHFPAHLFPAPPYQAPALSTPGPSAPAAASIPTTVTSALAAATPAPAATASAVRPINFIMVMDGEKGKRGIMKSKTIRKTPPVLKDYNPLNPLANDKIVLIIEEVEQKIREEAVREMKLTDQEDREVTVKAELKAAAQKHFPTDASSAAAWTDRNWVALYNQLSKPLTNIMQKLKSVAESQYIQGYGLRPGARSPDALKEKTYAKKKVKQLIPPAKPGDEFAPLAFTYDSQSNPLENPVIWNVLLDTIHSLGYNKYVGDAESLDHLFRSATVAVYCCLDQVPRGKKLQFSKADHSFIYDKVHLFMDQVIYADKVKTRNWIEFRRITHLKLTTKSFYLGYC
ncbi:hypothetical protein F4604DRAFT_1927398 [Suillus subluteus]|nr:hypothetical protein F4604DRAFT_1927398 [Suillus subluteus]